VIKCQLISAEWQKASRDSQATKLPFVEPVTVSNRKLKNLPTLFSRILPTLVVKSKTGGLLDKATGRVKLQRATYHGESTVYTTVHGAMAT
jgi:hypothetical protein